MQVGIIGVGLIGGSMAVDLKNRGFADRVVGVEADALHASAAKELRLVDEIVSYEECIAMSDMIVVAVPVSIAIRMIPDILDKVDRQVVTDVCSTKEKSTIWFVIIRTGRILSLLIPWQGQNIRVPGLLCPDYSTDGQALFAMLKIRICKPSNWSSKCMIASI